MKLFISKRENDDKGCNVHCEIGKKTYFSYFSSPSKTMIGDREYLLNRGYKLTDKQYLKFIELWKDLFAKKMEESENV